MSWFLGCTIGSGVIGLLFFLYHLKKGQFDDTEETKYQMFRPQSESRED